MGSRLAAVAPLLGLMSILVTLAIWAWVLTRPEGTFHDQGGLEISLIYFPLALLGWVILGLPAFVIGLVRTFRSNNAYATKHRNWNALAMALGVSSLLMAFGTLFIA